MEYITRLQNIGLLIVHFLFNLNNGLNILRRKYWDNLYETMLVSLYEKLIMRE